MDIKGKLLSYWNAFIALLKKGYFALEDRYYAFLDLLNNYIPVYKVIDPIDRHFPSFILFVIIIIGLVAGLLMLFLFPAVMQPYNATLVVIDADSKDALPGLDVFFSYLDKNASAKTGKFGEIKIENLTGTVSVNVKVGKTRAYEGLEKTVVVSNSGPYYLALKGGAAVLAGQKTIIVKDRKTNLPIEGRTMGIEFSCSSGEVSKWNKQASTPEYEEDVPINCGTMRAKVSVQGYEIQERDLVNEKTNFLLNPTGDDDDTKGTIVVYVKSAEDDEPLPGMAIYLYGADGIQKNAGISDTSGSYVFEVNPGKYYASAMDSTGEYSPAESATEQVNSNDFVQIELIMIPVADENRIKLLARLVDSGTNEAVSDAQFKLFVDDAEIQSYPSDANGFVKVRGIEEGHEFSAVITHPDYVTQIVESIEPIKETENTATIIKLVRAYRPACGNGIIELGESCDSNELNGMGCSAFGFPSGNLKCSSACQLDTSECAAQLSCGNGIIDLGETCDIKGPNLDGKTCSSFDGFTGGTLECSSSCQVSTGNCTGGNGAGICGDGNVNIGETCDVLGPNLDGKSCSNFDSFMNGVLGCRSGCSLDTSQCIAPPTCGNGLIDPGETCDSKGSGVFNNLQCADFDDFGGGTLSCTDSCTIDTSSCTDGPAVNVGSIIISVADEGAEAVEGAEAHLYNAAYPSLDMGKKFTDSEGKTGEYENLPAGEYFAEASNDTGSGTSPEKDLVLNQTIELPVVLTLGESAIEVYVSNSEGTAINGAEVKFYEQSDGRQIARTTTDASGKASASLRVDLNPYIVVSASGYLPYTTTAIALVKDNVAKIYVVLYENVDVGNALGIKIAGVYDALLNGRKVTQLASGSEYYFRFNVIVPASTTYSDVIAHIRTDLDSILNASDSGMKFWIKAISVSGASAIKSATFDPSDPYSNQNEVQTDAKQANISFGDLDAGAYELYARTYIKSGLPNNTLIELHYSAKSEESSTSALLEQYYIGKAFCTDCTFAYAFSLDGTSIDPTATTELLQDTDYELGYEIYNAGNADYDDVTAGFSDSANALILTPTSDSLGNIDSKATVSDSISMQGRAEVALTQLLMQLSPNVKDNNATAKFKVLAKNPMVISASPPYLYPRMRNILSIAVSDGSGHPIEGALIKLSLDSDFTGILASGNSESNGAKRFNIDALEPDTIIYISAEKPNYIAASAEVEVKDVYYPPAGADFSCLEIEDVDGVDIGADGLPDVNILKGWHSTFKVNSSECLEDSSITLSSELSLSSDSANCSNPKTSLTLDLQTTDSKTLCVIANQYQGEYPVYANAKFASSTEFSRIAELTVYAYDTSSCFWIDKTAFDIFNAIDSGIISNKCYSYVEDDNYPYLNPDAEAIALALTAEPLNEEILMLENFKGMEITKDKNSVDFNISVTGNARVELKQADIYMGSAGETSDWKWLLSFENDTVFVDPGTDTLTLTPDGTWNYYTSNQSRWNGGIVSDFPTNTTASTSGTFTYENPFPMPEEIEEIAVECLGSPENAGDAGGQDGSYARCPYTSLGITSHTSQEIVVSAVDTYFGNAVFYLGIKYRPKQKAPSAAKHALSIQTSSNVWNSITAQYYPDYYPTIDANGWVENYAPETEAVEQETTVVTEGTEGALPDFGINNGDGPSEQVWDISPTRLIRLEFKVADTTTDDYQTDTVTTYVKYVGDTDYTKLGCYAGNTDNVSGCLGELPRCRDSYDCYDWIKFSVSDSTREIDTVKAVFSSGGWHNDVSIDIWNGISSVYYTRNTSANEVVISGFTGENLHFAFCDYGDRRISLEDTGSGNNHGAGPSEEQITTSQRVPNSNGCYAWEGPSNNGAEACEVTCEASAEISTQPEWQALQQICNGAEPCDAYARLGADLKADKMRIEVNPEEEEIPEATTGTQLTCKSGIFGYCDGDELICPEGYEPEMYSEGESETQALCYGSDGSALYSGMCVKQYETDCSSSPACSSYVDETFYSQMPSNICYLAIVGGGESCITQEEHFESYPEDSEVSSASCTLPPEAIEEPANPRLDLAKWTYIRTKPNAPEITFDVENVSLDGTAYAVITVRDYTTDAPQPEMQDIALNWAVSSTAPTQSDGVITGSKQWIGLADTDVWQESDKVFSCPSGSFMTSMEHKAPCSGGICGVNFECTEIKEITLGNKQWIGLADTDVWQESDKVFSCPSGSFMTSMEHKAPCSGGICGVNFECTKIELPQVPSVSVESGAFTIENPEAGRVYEVGTYAFEAAPEVSDWKWLLRVENDSAFVVDGTDAFLMSPDGTWYQVSSGASPPFGIVIGLTTGSTTVASSGTYEEPFPMPEDTAEIAVELLGLPGSLPSCIGTSGDNCGGHINIRNPTYYNIVNYSEEEINVRFIDGGGDGRAVFFAGIKYKSYLPAEYGVSDDSNLVEVFIDPSAKKVYAKVLGTPAPTTVKEEKFHVKLQSGYANLCYGRDDVPGNFGSEKVPKVKFDWGWSNIGIDACDADNSNAVYCDATQFGISLMKRIELIDGLQNTDNNYSEAEKYKHFSAYLMKDGYSEDFQADFSTYFQNAFFGASSWFTEGDTGFANIFEDPVRFVFTTFDSTGANPREKVKPLSSPGLYNADIGFVYDNPDVNDFFSSGAAPNVTVNVYLTFAEAPEDDNPFYYLPFNGSIGMEDGVYARAGYGLGYEGSELLISQTALESIKTATSASDNTIATEKHTDFDTVNITYAGSVLIATPDSVSLLPSDATPVLMRVKENNGYADAFYSLRDGDARFGTNADYMASWTGIASNNDCRDFAGNALYSNRRDYLANDITHHATLEPSDIGDSAFGFSWENADANAEIYLRSVLYAPIGNTIDLFSAYLTNPLFVSPNAQITSTTEPIRLNYTSAVLNGGEPIITSLADVFELASEDKLCIASSAGNIDFYWNPEFISEALKPYPDEVNEILCRD